MPYRPFALLISACFAGMGLCLLVTPGLFVLVFDLPAEPGAAVMAHRAGVVYLGVAGFAALSAGAQGRAEQRVLPLCVIGIMLAMAALGVVEVLRGAAGLRLLLGVAAELLLAGIALSALRRA
ncbi:hypothetical protein FHY55_04080 [Oceanicola sp. D3]|uniref:hypothetical protein n=1 Tax=Oceanicola sp. D3 TaxID=2587163 RepID=UPI00111F6541|nr:hypothetical protein [Oceanicola sp. D3]QDC08473.1 hypothetical protein FHY55_04080 [Oceanicola sp. D3]